MVQACINAKTAPNVYLIGCFAIVIRIVPTGATKARKHATKGCVNQKGVGVFLFYRVTRIVASDCHQPVVQKLNLSVRMALIWPGLSATASATSGFLESRTHIGGPVAMAPKSVS